MDIFDSFLNDNNPRYTFGPYGAVTYTKKGKLIFITKEELEYFDEGRIKKPEIRMSLYEIAEIFPNASTTIKEQIKNKNQKLRELNETEYKIKMYVDRKVEGYQKQLFIKEVLIYLHVEHERAEISQELKDLKTILFHIQQNKKTGTGDQRKFNIEKARNIPVTNFLEFNKAGYTRCPFHEEKTASCYYNEKKSRRAHCFGCGKNFDSIELIMHRKNCNFLEAVSYLLK